MDPKAFLLQKFNRTAQERVSCGYLRLNLDYVIQQCSIRMFNTTLSLLGFQYQLIDFL